jgi:prepilin-type processing-associated H-X9-DG protein
VQFTLQTLLLVFVVLWSSLALFGLAGIGVFFFVLVVALILCKIEDTVILLLLLSLGTLVAIVLFPAVNVGEAGPRARCMNNLKQISLAVLTYEAQYHCFPPAYIPDKDGKPMHSWRVLMLPYLQYKDLYQQYNFNEPWDGPNNRKLLVKGPRIFACPSDKNVGATTTSYVAVVGKNALWRAGKPRSLDELALREGTNNTVMLVEVANSGINWSEPRDFCLDEPKAAGSGSPVSRECVEHLSSPGFFFQDRFSGACIAFADGHVQFLPGAAVASDKLKDWLAVGGFKDEEIDGMPPSYGRTINWTNCAALVVWIASVGLLLYRARRSRKERCRSTRSS